jgi:hypothetical protein
MKKFGVLAMVLGLMSTAAIAYPGDRQVSDDTVGINTLEGDYTHGPNKLEISYSYLLFGPRDIVIKYDVKGIKNCNGEAKFEGQQGISIKDKITIDCDLNPIGTYPTHVEICSWDNGKQKSCDDKDGQLTVR